MLSKTWIAALLLITAFRLSAQTTISGVVTNSKQQPLAGASIVIENSYYGATSAADGSFSFTTPDTGAMKLVITLIGYKSFEQLINAHNSNITLRTALKESVNELNAVTVTAGSFEASDRKRTTVLKPLDIVTTPGQQADIVAALKTLPGAQQVGEQEGLFVRGGSGYETKVFIDGMMVSNPFYSSVPDIGQRARFSPLLFRGTIFSSGGYSAQYGQALSSALLLETLDLPSRSETNMVISNAQLILTNQQLNKSKTGSAGITLNYSNMAPYYSVVPQKYHYVKAPEMVSTEFNARKKFRKGMLKLYGYANYNTIHFDSYSVEAPDGRNEFSLTNHSIFSTITYVGSLSSRWKLNAGASYSYNTDTIRQLTKLENTILSYFEPRLSNGTFQARMVFTRQLAGLSKLYIGAEYQNLHDRVIARDSIPDISIRDHYFAFFAESDIYISNQFMARVGLRMEHSNLLQRNDLAPRLSLAYKLNDKSQLSAAYGDFYQKPETNFLFRKPDLFYTKATHYILNYQRIGNGKTFRVELFRKNYHDLVTYERNNPARLGNSGTGYAQGLEIFLRDKTTFKAFDYWISYSFLDTKRQYLDYPSKVQPGFAAKHTASLVVKKFISPLSTYVTMAYTYASGRPYYNPNRPMEQFMKDRTIDYHTMGLQLNYLVDIGKAKTVFILNVSNVPGNNQVYYYRFASQPDNSGLYRSIAVTPPARRFIFIGAYLSIGVDRRKEIIDN